jgi:putative Holliday junction resolvase
LRYTPRRPKAQISSKKPSREGLKLQGRVLAIDMGSKKVGLAVSDELRLTVRALPPLPRTPWKRLLSSLAELCEQFDVRSIVLGLPLRLDGAEGDAAQEIRRLGRNLRLSLKLPLFFQDERLTSKEAESSLRERGLRAFEISDRVDSEAASIILSDFLEAQNGAEG